MKIAPWILAASLAVLVADPAMAQGRAKDDSQRTRARQPATADQGERRRDPARATTARAPERPAPPVRPRDRRGRDRRIIPPITVRSPRPDPYRYSDYDRRYDSRYDARYGTRYEDRYGRRVWGRVGGMSCSRLADELEWAHDEWHWRNDRHRNRSWYDIEHARLELRIAEERVYSGCGRDRARHDDRDCRNRGRHARTGSALEAAILVLDILLGSDHERNRW